MHLKGRAMSRGTRQRPRQPGRQQVAPTWADPLLAPGPQPAPIAPFPDAGTGAGLSGSFRFGPNPDVSGPRYRLAEGEPAWGRLDGSGVEPPPGMLATVNMSTDRIHSIGANEPALFEISGNPEAESAPTWNEFAIAGWRAVRNRDDIIAREAQRVGLDPDLLRAVIYLENARGPYGLVADPVHEMVPGDLREQARSSDWHLGWQPDWEPAHTAVGAIDSVSGWVKEKVTNPSIFPMNIQPRTWSALSLDFDNAFDPAANIRAVATLLRRIVDRTPDPDPAKIGSIWHFAGAERVDDLGAALDRVYRSKPWTDNGLNETLRSLPRPRWAPFP